MFKNPPHNHPAYLTRPPHQVFPEDIDCVCDPAPGRGAIFIGNLEAAENLATLKKHQIGSLLTACKNIHIRHPKEQVPFTLYIPGEDHQDYDLSFHFETAADFIHHSLRQTNILVHCMAGISRSATLVLAYLMKYQRLSLQQAFSLITRRRGKINPNPGFIRQLKKYHAKIQGSGKGLPEDNSESENNRPISHYERLSLHQTDSKAYVRNYGKHFKKEAQMGYGRQEKVYSRVQAQALDNPESSPFASQYNLRHSLKPQLSLYEQEPLRRPVQPLSNHTNYSTLGADFSIDKLSRDLEDRIAKIKQKYYERSSSDYRSIEPRGYESIQRGQMSVSKAGERGGSSRVREMQLERYEFMRSSIYSGMKGYRAMTSNYSFMGSHL